MTELEKRMIDIKNEIDTKVISSNIKDGTQIFGVTGNVNFESMPEYNVCKSNMLNLLGLKVVDIDYYGEHQTEFKTPIRNNTMITLLVVTGAPREDNFPVLLGFQPLTLDDYTIAFKENATPEEMNALRTKIMLISNDVPFVISPMTNDDEFPFSSGKVKYGIGVMDVIGQDPNYEATYIGHFDLPLYAIDSTGTTGSTTISFDFI